MSNPGTTDQLADIRQRLQGIAAEAFKVDQRRAPRPEGKGQNVGNFRGEQRTDLAACAVRVEDLINDLSVLRIYPGRSDKASRDAYAQYERLYVNAIVLLARLDGDAGLRAYQVFREGNRSPSAIWRAWRAAMVGSVIQS